MEEYFEIVIPPPLSELLLLAASKTELSVEDIVEKALRKQLEQEAKD